LRNAFYDIIRWWCHIGHWYLPYCNDFPDINVGGGRPEGIKATNYFTDTGVDELISVAIKYPGMGDVCFTTFSM